MSKDAQSYGLNFCEVLTLVFIVLKLCKVIDWSWWWVLSPVWIPLAIVLGLFALYEILSKITK
jgi:hypothetical protein